MIIGESLRTGLVEIYSNKMRSFLSFAAISFGAAAILYTFAIVNQAFQKQKQAFDLVGPGPMQITHHEWRKKDDESLRLSRGLTSDDAEAIRKALPWLTMVSPTVRTWGRMRFKQDSEWVNIRGVTDEWRNRNWVYTLRGRWFDKDDFDNAERVCILIEPGGWAKGKPLHARKWAYYKRDFDAIITHNNLLGQELTVNNRMLTVIGILKEPPKDKDPRWFKTGGRPNIIVPLKTAQRYLRNSWGNRRGIVERIGEIDIDTGSLSSVPTAKRRIETLLKVLHRGERDYTVTDLRQEIQNKLNEMREHAVTIMSLGAIAILAGGVGIMNVTLATIFSRIREIGIRRSIGATRFDVLSQFVTEAMLLGVLGGAAGIVLGMGCLLFLAEEGVEKMEALVWWHHLATMGISMGTCFLFSLYPAFQASRLDPVQALRYE